MVLTTADRLAVRSVEARRLPEAEPCPDAVPALHPAPDLLAHSVPLQRGERLGTPAVAARPGAACLESSEPMPPQVEAALRPRLDGKPFEAAVEFPNFFAAMPSARERLEAAVASVLRRQMGLVVADSIRQSRCSQSERLYGHLDQELNRYLHEELGAPPEERVDVLTGARAALGYVYERMFDAWSNPPHVAPEHTLQQIALEDGDLEDLHTRGAASDWDLYLQCAAPYANKLAKHARRVGNELGEKFNWQTWADDDRAVFFSIPDAKPYAKHQRLTMEQGGCTLDWLAFDVRRGRFVEPPADVRSEPLHVVDDFLAGRLGYLAPSVPEKLWNPGKQAVRGLRPLLEIPFLAYPHPTQLLSELDGLLAALREGSLAPEDQTRTIQQLRKLVGNQRCGGANARPFRGGPGSVEAKMGEVLDALTHAQRAQEPTFQERLLPEMLPCVRTGPRSLGVPFLDGDGFRRQWTDAGRLYFLSPYAHALGVLRSGPFHTVSGKLNPQGLRGAVTFPTRREAMEQMHGDSDAMVELRLRQDRPLRMLDWAAARSTPEVARLLEEAGGDERRVFERLGTEFGVDGIVRDGRVHLQRADALESNTTRADVTRAFGSLVEHMSHADADSLPLPRRADGAVDFEAVEKVFQRRAAVFETYQLLSFFMSTRNEVDFAFPEAYQLRLEASNARLYARAWSAAGPEERAGRAPARDVALKMTRHHSRGWAQALRTMSRATESSDRDPLFGAQLPQRVKELMPDFVQFDEAGRLSEFAAAAERGDDAWFRQEDPSGFGLTRLLAQSGVRAADLLELTTGRELDPHFCLVVLLPAIVDLALADGVFRGQLAEAAAHGPSSTRQVATLLCEGIREGLPRAEILIPRRRELFRAVSGTGWTL